MNFWKTCKHCNGSGEVNPNSPYARKPAQMSGEIIERSTSVCKKCSGCGMTWKMTTEK